MKAIVTGAGGQLGRALLAHAPADVEVAAATSQDLDIADAEAVHAMAMRERPTIIVNAAAYTAVDQAEADPEGAAAVNDQGVANLVAAAAAAGARLAHVSTDFVFDGTASHPYGPNDRTAPVSVYGATKLAGEGHLRPADLCVRTAWVYAAQGRNFVRTMLRLMAERTEISVVADQIGSPTSADDLAQALWRLALAGHAGMFHYTGSGVASWFDFAVAIRDEGIALGLLGRDAAQVRPIATSAYPTPARRPAFSVLAMDKTSAALGGDAPYWRHSLIKVLEQIKTHG